ncbi:MAG: type IX secretion system membrane protein PorP/SprF, partial [Saprospiraceae bacterium]
GINYAYRHSKRTGLTIGGSIFHLNKPNQNFYGASAIKANLPYRVVYSGAGQIAIASSLDFIVAAQLQMQEDYREQNVVGKIRFYANKKPGQLLNVLVGAGMRINDAIIPSLGFEYNNWLISGSFDINTSAFKTATNKRGGPELALQYIFRSVQPSGIFKKCPIY